MNIDVAVNRCALAYVLWPFVKSLQSGSNLCSHVDVAVQSELLTSVLVEVGQVTYQDSSLDEPAPSAELGWERQNWFAWQDDSLRDLTRESLGGFDCTEIATHLPMSRSMCANIWSAVALHRGYSSITIQKAFFQHLPAWSARLAIVTHFAYGCKIAMQKST